MALCAMSQFAVFGEQALLLTDVPLCLPEDLEVPYWCHGKTLVHSFELPEPSPSNNIIKELHYHAYRQLRLMWKIKMLSKGFPNGRPERPIEKAALVIGRRCAGQLDWDNAYGGLKPLLDCLVQRTKRNPDGLGVVVDDSPRNMPYPPFVQQLPAKRGDGSTHILIFDLGTPG